MAEVREFKEKWQALKRSGLRPSVQTYEQLAELLNLSGKSAIGNWISNEDEGSISQIPDVHVDTLINKYGLARIIPNIDRYVFGNLPAHRFAALLNEGLPIWDRINGAMKGKRELRVNAVFTHS